MRRTRKAIRSLADTTAFPPPALPSPNSRRSLTPFTRFAVKRFLLATSVASAEAGSGSRIGCNFWLSRVCLDCARSASSSARSLFATLE